MQRKKYSKEKLPWVIELRQLFQFFPAPVHFKSDWRIADCFSNNNADKYIVETASLRAILVGCRGWNWFDSQEVTQYVNSGTKDILYLILIISECCNVPIEGLSAMYLVRRLLEIYQENITRVFTGKWKA